MAANVIFYTYFFGTGNKKAPNIAA